MDRQLAVSLTWSLRDDDDDDDNDDDDGKDDYDDGDGYCAWRACFCLSFLAIFRFTQQKTRRTAHVPNIIGIL